MDLWYSLHFKDDSIVLESSDVNDKLSPPIKLKNNKFTQPFSIFVEKCMVCPHINAILLIHKNPYPLQTLAMNA